MSPEHTPLFLARRGYRRRRLADAARVLPLFGGALFCLPLLWKGTERAGGTVQALIYVFGLWVVLITAGPIMMAGLLIGLIVALFQALTTIQEMTLTFVPKIIVIFLAIMVFLPFMMTEVVEFSRRLFDRMIALGIN